MLKLQEFIFNHPENWKELLSDNPYCLKIKEEDNFILFYYNQIDSDFNNEIVRECRGIILHKDTFEVLCYPFNKFGNYGESYVNLSDFDMDSLWVSEKIDGSMIKLWNYDNEWHISTSSMINAKDANVGSVLCETYYDLFLMALNNNGFTFEDFVKPLCKNFTYIFELVSPYNRVVIPYDKADIYFIGCRNNTLNSEIYFNSYGLLSDKIKRPQIFNMKSIEDVIKVSESLPWDKEGYVVCDKNFNRCKIKSPLYVAAHYARTNGNISVSSLIKIVLNNEIEEFLIYADDYTDKIYDIKNYFTDVETLANSYLDMFYEFIKTDSKKEFVERLNNSIIKYREFMLPFLYKNYDSVHKGIDIKYWKDYTQDWTDNHFNRWEKLYNSKQ